MVEPEYEELPGFEGQIGECRREQDLPAEARSYLAAISEHLGIPIRLVGVGPGVGPGHRHPGAGTAVAPAVRQAMDAFAFHRALAAIWEFVGEVNRYVDQKAPFSLAPAVPSVSWLLRFVTAPSVTVRKTL